MKRKFALGLSVGILIVCLVVGLPGSTAYAANPAQDGVVLENLLKREQIVIGDQQVRLNLAHQVISAAQTWIDDLNAEGKDTAALQTALTNFQNGVAQAQTSFDSAQSLLNSHAGFDGSGQITDKVQALKTLVDAGHAERQFHLTITQATLDFRLAVHRYIQPNI